MSIVARNVQSYVPVNLLEPSSETQKIRVKIINRWTLYNSKSGNSIELVLVDLSGTRLHASIENDLTSSFPFKFAILRTTRTKELTNFPDDVPEKYFIDFGGILDEKYERNLLIGEISISNAFSATKILFDHNTEQADHFRNIFPSNRQSITQGAFKQISHGNSVDVRTEFFSRNPRKTLNGILESSSVQEYGEFSDDDGSQPKYNCKTCGDVNLVFPRYFLVVRAHDDTDQTRFLIFDQISENLLGKSAEDLMRKYDELDHIPVYPELLDSIVEKRVLFKVTLKVKNNKFVNSPLVVDCVLEDEDMIDEWLANSSESLQLTGGEDCSESSFAEIQTPGSKNDNQAIVVEDQRSVSKWIKVERKK
ncbi:hypothetical protein Bca101_019920 [Brassica carinata]